MKELWTAFVGVQANSASRVYRLGQVEGLEERRVLANTLRHNGYESVAHVRLSDSGTIATSSGITGLDANTVVRGIDFRPATGELYALGIVDNGATQTGRLYQLNTANAVAVPVGPAFSSNLSNADHWEIDFNPTVDRVRVVNNLNDNLRLNPNDGSLVATDTTLTGGTVRGIAYDRNEGASLSTLFAYQFTTDRLATIGGIQWQPFTQWRDINVFPNPSGIFAFGPNPFDIGSGSTTGSWPQRTWWHSSLVSMNLSTGAATSLGAIGNGTLVITGLAVPLQSLTVVGTSGSDTLVVTRLEPTAVAIHSTVGQPFLSATLSAFVSLRVPAATHSPSITQQAACSRQPVASITAAVVKRATLCNYSAAEALRSIKPICWHNYAAHRWRSGNNGDGLVRFTGPTTRRYSFHRSGHRSLIPLLLPA